MNPARWLVQIAAAPAGAEHEVMFLMSRLTDYSTLLLAIYGMAQELPVARYQDAVLDTLKTLLPFDSSMWGTATMRAEGIDIHSIHLHNSPREMLEAYESIKHLDVAAHKVASLPCATLAFNAQNDFPGPELAVYRDYLQRFGHQNTLITCEIHPITRFGQWVTLWRADPSHVCTAEDAEVLASLAPHLMQALAINRRIHLDRLMGDVAREKWSVAIADRRGVLYHEDPRFHELVALEWRGGDLRLLPPDMLARLENDDHVTGRRVVVRRTVEHDLLFLKARLREDVDDLTAREVLVASLLASGLTQKEVAARLGRSPETIRSQLKTIFQKLGINNAMALPGKLVLRS
jgi:DNA-binding CsgD family transcriptional regulator